MRVSIPASGIVVFPLLPLVVFALLFTGVSIPASGIVVFPPPPLNADVDVPATVSIPASGIVVFPLSIVASVATIGLYLFPSRRAGLLFFHF